MSIEVNFYASNRVLCSPPQKTGTRAQGQNNPRAQGLSKPKPKGNVTKKMNFSDVSSDSESDNQLLFKTPNPIRRTKKTVQATGKENKPKPPPGVIENKDSKGKTPKALPKYISLLSDDSEDDDSFQSIGSISSSTDNTSSTNVSSTVDSLFKLPTPVSKGRQARVVTPLATRGSHTYSFLRSLSVCVEEEGRRHPDAVRYSQRSRATVKKE